LQTAAKIILGIDPGTIVMGYSLIRCQGNQIELMDYDVLKPGLHKDIYRRLHLIHETVSGLITKYQPTSLAIEAPFFGKNVQSMLKLGRAQGVAIAAAMQAGIEVVEYAPKRVKQSVTGNGNANKEQVWKMLQQLLRIVEKPDYFDATDALAVAICHHYTQQNPVQAHITTTKKKKSGGWDSFLRDNADRIHHP